jgi:sugar fermentation stimulation protein A
MDGGEEVMAHLPNPGRLTGTVSPRCEVLLDGPFPAPRVCPYTVVAFREPSALVGAVTTYANRLFEATWQHGVFPELSGEELSTEIVHGQSRFDFRIDETFVEVKSVTFAKARSALFPDAVTARGARHCRELAAFGPNAAIVFVAQRGDVDSIRPADEIDPKFAAALRSAASAGVQVLGCAVEITPAGARDVRRIPVLLTV